MGKIINILNPLPGLQLLFRNRALLKQLVRRNVISKYQGSILGILWNIIHPLMMLCIYTFVFSVVFQSRWGTGVGPSKGSFAIILFCGMTVYSIFADAVNMSAIQITLNPNYVKKVVFPLPAPARSSSGPSVAKTALRCSEFSSANWDSIYFFLAAKKRCIICSFISNFWSNEA